MRAGRLLLFDNHPNPHPVAREVNRLRIPVLQGPRCLRGLWLKLRYSGVVFGREIQEPLPREGVGLYSETAATLCLFFQRCYIHHEQTGRLPCRLFNRVKPATFLSGLLLRPSGLHSPSHHTSLISSFPQVDGQDQNGSR